MLECSLRERASHPVRCGVATNAPTTESLNFFFFFFSIFFSVRRMCSSANGAAFSRVFVACLALCTRTVPPLAATSYENLDPEAIESAAAKQIAHVRELCGLESDTVASVLLRVSELIVCILRWKTKRRAISVVVHDCHGWNCVCCHFLTPSFCFT